MEIKIKKKDIKLPVIEVTRSGFMLEVPKIKYNEHLPKYIIFDTPPRFVGTVACFDELTFIY